MPEKHVTAASSTEDANLPPAPSGDAARLADRVASIAGIRPDPPEGLLAPRLRVPRLAAWVALAAAVHVAGLVLHLLVSRTEGAGGRHAQAFGFTAIDTEIVDGRDVPDPGGRVEEAAAGLPGPESPVSSEQALAEHKSTAAPVLEPVSEPQPPVQELPPPTPERPERAAGQPEQPTIDRPAEEASGPAIPPPTLTVDSSETEPRQPPVSEPERFREQEVEMLPQARESPTAPSPPAEPTLPPAAAEPSTAGEAGMAQATVESAGNGGPPAASAGRIRTYHRHLQAHIAAHRPFSRGRVGRVTVRFVLNTEGVVQNVVVVASTGNAELEARTLAAMRRASPFPKPPAGMTKLAFTVPFGFGL